MKWEKKDVSKGVWAIWQRDIDIYMWISVYVSMQTDVYEMFCGTEVQSEAKVLWSWKWRVASKWVLQVP